MAPKFEKHIPQGDAGASKFRYYVPKCHEYQIYSPKVLLIPLNISLPRIHVATAVVPKRSALQGLRWTMKHHTAKVLQGRVA